MKTAIPKIVISAALVLSVLLPTSLLAQTDEITISAQQLAGNVYMLSGRGGNIGVLIGEDGTLQVDHPNAELYPKTAEKIKELGGGPARILVNTHYHLDHTGGNELISQSGAVTIAHENVRKRQMSGNSIAYFQIQHPPLSGQWLPDIAFEIGLTLHFNGEEIEVYHVGPAHTDGDAVVYFKNANVVHVGDIFFNEIYPFIDLENGGNFEGLIKAIDDILAKINENTHVIPGHGPVTDYAGFKAYRDMLATIMNRVQGMVDDGRSLEEIIAAKPTVEFDEGNQGFIPADDLVKFVYDDLTP
ncbi:MAG: MBL fold metallo-hydrolase [Candidatus Zixiibacteriota bacterium]|nr:MAG: MBL fold metallo-hydrolase [candidate division Zixibacteria bacterium]